jgi:hypothetical protein
MGEQKVSQPEARAAPSGQLRHNDATPRQRQTSDIPLPSTAIAVLALEATPEMLTSLILWGSFGRTDK